ncbi:hypothetical protein Lalb_Chr07g0193331 [Lupinus albus]|uniref:Uncharacterized protein n=1 Tax=Lupinus albus TaxID=3870 RepID=A0A6A4QBQ5_LUPAL|nr:hypothetical protein Lalb_Chr07g0193331 [Lupinus albus]
MVMAKDDDANGEGEGDVKGEGRRHLDVILGMSKTGTRRYL